MLIQCRVLLSLVLGILLPVVCSNDVISIKSNSLTALDQSRSGESSSIGGIHRMRRASPTPDEIRDITSLHNSLRGLEGASDMEYMKWNPHLAELAQQWAERCDFKHGQPSFQSCLFPYSDIGQNIYATTGTLTFNAAIKSSWYDEKQWYNYDNISCPSGKVCGHYTQVVWAQSYEIGCGYSKCQNLKSTTFGSATIFVCNYGPPGNYVGAKPFEKGQACSQCQTGAAWCTQGLCNRDCSKTTSDCTCQSSCLRCGSSNITNNDPCICSCKPGWNSSSISDFVPCVSGTQHHSVPRSPSTLLLFVVTAIFTISIG